MTTIHTCTWTYIHMSTWSPIYMHTQFQILTQLCTQLKIHIPIAFWFFEIRFHHWAQNAIKNNHQTVFRMFLFVEHIFNDYELNITNSFAYATHYNLISLSLTLVLQLVLTLFLSFWYSPGHAHARTFNLILKISYNDWNVLKQFNFDFEYLTLKLKQYL